jgi:hypothetical protein
MSLLKTDENIDSQVINSYFGGLAALLRPRNIRASAAYAHDIFMTGIAFIAAIYLQLGWQFLTAFEPPLWKGIICYALVSAGTFSFTRLYRSLWCYASLPDMVSIAKSVTIATALFIPLYFLSADLSKLPIEALAVSWFISVTLLGAPRMMARLTVDHRNVPGARNGKNTVPLLLAGAGDGNHAAAHRDRILQAPSCGERQDRRRGPAKGQYQEVFRLRLRRRLINYAATVFAGNARR